jgi:hypothetical protein
MLRLMLRTILTLNPASVVASDDRPGDKINTVSFALLATENYMTKVHKRN